MMSISNYRIWILLFYITTVFILSLNSIVLFDNQWKYDIYIHFVEYFILGFLFMNAALSYDKVRFFYIILFLIIIPVLDESIQYYVPGRISSLKDIFIDIVGGVIGSSCRYVILKKLDIK